MSPRAVANIRASFAEISPRLDQVVDHFYAGLFLEHPGVRKIFPPDMTRQKEHVGAALAVLFRNIDSLEALEGPLLEMGARHVGYGATPDHYPAVRDALLAAIRVVSGPSWNEQLDRDWTEALNRICEMMLRGASAAALAVAQAMRSGNSEAARPAIKQPAPGAASGVRPLGRPHA
jgi:hemoglobin-like flavoprotein